MLTQNMHQTSAPLVSLNPFYCVTQVCVQDQTPVSYDGGRNLISSSLHKLQLNTLQPL